MKLYHGTTKENKKEILSCGYIKGKVFLTDRIDIAKNYGDGTIISVDVNENNLEIDFDFPGSKTLNVENANKYLETEYESVEDFIKNGYSVAHVKNIYIEN